jgi:2-oxo-4-hydroxy-4-carboxy--5-ureidoimidazoline (OHCU) decarboxylase
LVLSTQYNAESLQERASNRVAAQDFLKMDQGDFIKKHPDLAPHVAAVSAIKKKLASEPMTDQQRQTAMQRVRENAANSIQEGVKPDIKLKTQTQNLKNDLSR